MSLHSSCCGVICWEMSGSGERVLLAPTQRLHSSSFLGLPCRILNMNPKKELRWSLRVNPKPLAYRNSPAGISGRQQHIPSARKPEPSNPHTTSTDVACYFYEYYEYYDHYMVIMVISITSCYCYYFSYCFYCCFKSNNCCNYYVRLRPEQTQPKGSTSCTLISQRPSLILLRYFLV